LKGSTRQMKVDLTELKGSTQQNKVDLTELKGSTRQNKIVLTELKGSTQQNKIVLTELKGSTQQNKIVLTELKGSTQQNKFELTELKGLVNKHNLDLQACAENVTALKQKVGECETMYPRLNEVEGGVKDVKAKLVLVESSITNLTSLSTRLDQHQLILNALNDKPNKTTFEAIETQTKIDIAQVKAMIIRESNALKTNITSLTNTISKIQASLAQQQFVDVNAFNSKTKQLTISINDLDGALKQITSKMTDLDQIKAKTLILDTLKTTTDSLQQRFTELHDLTSHLAEKDKERTEETNVWVPLMTQQSTELQKLRENLNVTTTSVSDNLKELVELHNKFTLFESKTDRGLETCSESVGELEKSVNKIEGVLRGIPSFFSLNSKAMFFAELKKSLFFSPGIVLPKTVEIKSLYITTNRVPKQTRLFELSVVANGVTTVLDSFEKPSTDEVIMQDYLYSLQVDAKSKILISCDKKITAMAVLTMQYI
jgi:chromosome segregation ATPase